MAAPNKSLESLFEVLVKDGVDERIDQRIDVTQPRQEVRHLHRSAARAARVDDQLLDKERQPANYESPDYQPERGGRLSLPRARDPWTLGRLTALGLVPGLAP